MKITIIDCPEGEEEEIIIKCRQMDEHLMRMIRTVKAGQERLIGTRNGQIMQIQPKEIYYFEAVDNRVFLYGEREVFETRYKLYELEERLGGTDFFRASKSVLLNLSKVKSFATALGGRFEANMKKDAAILEEVNSHLRSVRDTWKEVMKRGRQS